LAGLAEDRQGGGRPAARSIKRSQPSSGWLCLAGLLDPQPAPLEGIILQSSALATLDKRRIDGFT